MKHSKFLANSSATALTVLNSHHLLSFLQRERPNRTGPRPVFFIFDDKKLFYRTCLKINSMFAQVLHNKPMNKFSIFLNSSDHLKICHSPDIIFFNFFEFHPTLTPVNMYTYTGCSTICQLNQLNYTLSLLWNSDKGS